MSGVLFEPTGAQEEKLFIPHKEGIEVLNACIKQAEIKGHSLYICSNLQMPDLEILKQDYPDIMGVFKGIVTPSTALAKKPHPQIFKYLIDTYQLIPHESIFIDDQESNIIGAQDAGMIGIHAQDFGYVTRELQRLGVL